MNQNQSSQQHQITNSEAIIMWQTCLQIANDARKRQVYLNLFFIALLTIILLGMKNTMSVDLVTYFTDHENFRVFPSLALIGLAISISWIFLIHFHSKLNQSKMAIVCSIENQLNIQPMLMELNHFKQNNAMPKLGSILEYAFAVTFSIIYLFLTLSFF